MNRIINIGSYIELIRANCAAYNLDAAAILNDPIIQDTLNDDICPPVKVRFPKAHWQMADEYCYWQCSHCGATVYNGCGSKGQAQDTFARKDSPTLYPHCPYCGREMT